MSEGIHVVKPDVTGDADLESKEGNAKGLYMDSPSSQGHTFSLLMRGLLCQGIKHLDGFAPGFMSERCHDRAVRHASRGAVYLTVAEFGSMQRSVQVPPVHHAPLRGS